MGRGCDEALFSAEKGFFSEEGGGNSVNEGFGKDLYRKGNSVKRFGPFIEPPDSENCKSGAREPPPILKKTLREFGPKFWRPTDSESRSESCSENRVFT